nr:ATP-grasp domain-containing protein [Moraxella sp. CTOTU49097]
MKVFIKCNKKYDFINVNTYIANEGFNKLGWETIKFIDISEIQNELSDVVIISGIQDVKTRLEQLGISYHSDNIDYPNSLKSFFGREIWQSSMNELLSIPIPKPIFIKPKGDLKRFTGKIISSQTDLIGIVDSHNFEIWCSEIMSFVTEWRCFVRYGKLIDVRQYKGAWDSKIDLSIVKNAIESFKNAPNAYAIDFGITDKGDLYIVEVNEGFAVGSYGMNPINYAKFLSARWAELTNTEDYANF